LPVKSLLVVETAKFESKQRNALLALTSLSLWHRWRGRTPMEMPGYKRQWRGAAAHNGYLDYRDQFQQPLSLAWSRLRHAITSVMVDRTQRDCEITGVSRAIRPVSVIRIMR